MPPAPRYASLTDLLAAKQAGTLPDGAKMILDPYGAFLDGEASEAEELFAGDLSTTLRDALTALGLSVEVCPT